MIKISLRRHHICLAQALRKRQRREQKLSSALGRFQNRPSQAIDQIPVQPSFGSGFFELPASTRAAGVVAAGTTIAGEKACHQVPRLLDPRRAEAAEKFKLRNNINVCEPTFYKNKKLGKNYFDYQRGVRLGKERTTSLSRNVPRNGTGRLAQCTHNWSKITSDPWVLSQIQGHALELISTPTQGGTPREYQQSQLLDNKLATEIY